MSDPQKKEGPVTSGPQTKVNAGTKITNGFDVYGQLQVSYFKTCQDNKPESTRTVGNILNGFSGGDYRKQIEYLRTLPEDTYKEKKSILPAYTFTGIFPQRKKDSIESFTGLMPLDFDEVSNPAQLRDDLKQYPFIYSAFVSPSNRGVKALAVIPYVENDEQYKSIFKEVQKVIPAIDAACNDLTRLCFACYDPELWTNPTASVFDLPIEHFEVVKTPIIPQFENSGLTPWNDFDERGEIEPLILSHGWKFSHKSGAKIRYTRPGKNHGTSGDWHEVLRIFYCQSTNAPPLEKKGYRLHQLHAILNCGGDFRESARQIYALGYGDRKVNHGSIKKEPGQMNKREYDSLTDFEDHRITEKTPIPEPVPFMHIGSEITATADDITTFSGPSKSAKTGFGNIILSIATTTDGIVSNPIPEVKVLPNSNGLAVIHIDTEQARWKHQQNLKAILRRAFLDSCPDFFLSYNIRQLSLDEYDPITRGICEQAFRSFGGIHLINIDGIADYVQDVNDSAQAQAIVKVFMELAAKYHCPVITVIHVNPGSEKERGHLGSELQRKSGTVLTVKKDGDISYIEPRFLRYAGHGNMPIVQIQYDTSKGYFVSAGIRTNSTMSKDVERLSTLKKVAAEALQIPGTYRYATAIESIMKKTGKKERTAKDLFKEMKAHGYIIQINDLWMLNV